MKTIGRPIPVLDVQIGDEIWWAGRWVTVEEIHSLFRGENTVRIFTIDAGEELGGHRDVRYMNRESVVVPLRLVDRVVFEPACEQCRGAMPEPTGRPGRPRSRFCGDQCRRAWWSKRGNRRVAQTGESDGRRRQRSSGTPRSQNREQL